MRNIFLIARREYMEQVRSRSFRFSTILVPVLVLVLMGGNLLIVHHAHSGKHIAIAASDPALANAVKQQMLDDKTDGYSVDVADLQQSDPLLNQVSNQSIDGLLTIEPTTDGAPKLTYTSLSSGDIDLANKLKDAVWKAEVQKQLQTSGISQARIDGLFKEIDIDTLRIDKQGKTVKGSGMTTLIKVNGMLILILMPILLHGMDMARAIIEEKSSRIFEVMLSVVKPEESLAGKLLGTGAVGLTQIAIWVASLAVASGSAVVASMLGGNLDLHITAAEVVFYVVYFVLGFLFYSTIFSGLGATCETAQDLQMFASLIVIPVWLGMFAVINALTHPGSPWTIAASLCPITSPFVMVPRMGLETVPAWQLVSSLIILILSIWGVLWLSTRLYRVGILMYGKRATLPEILRWIRTS